MLARQVQICQRLAYGIPAGNDHVRVGGRQFDLGGNSDLFADLSDAAAKEIGIAIGMDLVAGLEVLVVRQLEPLTVTSQSGH